MRTTSQCKPRIPPSLAGRNRASQVLIVMHHLSHPLPQAKSVIDKSKDLLHNQLDSNTDTESIKQASDQTKSIPNPPEQCAICRGRSMKGLRPTDCKNPLDRSSNTEATKHKTFAAGSKRWSTFETCIRSVRPELRAGFRLPAAHSCRTHTLHMSRGKERDASEMVGPLLQHLCIQLDGKEECDKLRQSRSQASVTGPGSPTWLQQTKTYDSSTDERLFVM
jgi:hypothetical protein